MIQPNELRIGNYYKWYADGKDYYFKVDSKFLNDEDVINNSEPIPLTEEILLKCGFVFKPEGEEVYEQIWKLNNFEIWQHSEGFCHDFLNGGDVNYLHKLQNLIFELTNQELEINL